MAQCSGRRLGAAAARPGPAQLGGRAARPVFESKVQRRLRCRHGAEWRSREAAGSDPPSSDARVDSRLKVLLSVGGAHKIGFLHH